MPGDSWVTRTRDQKEYETMEIGVVKVPKEISDPALLTKLSEIATKILEGKERIKFIQSLSSLATFRGMYVDPALYLEHSLQPPGEEEKLTYDQLMDSKMVVMADLNKLLDLPLAIDFLISKISPDLDRDENIPFLIEVISVVKSFIKEVIRPNLVEKEPDSPER